MCTNIALVHLSRLNVLSRVHAHDMVHVYLQPRVPVPCIILLRNSRLVCLPRLGSWLHSLQFIAYKPTNLPTHLSGKHTPRKRPVITVAENSTRNPHILIALKI